MIEIYGTPTCVYCVKAKELAEQFKLKYTYIDLFEGDNYEKYTEKFPGASTVPQITWHGRHIGGYNDFAREIEETRNFGDGQV